nr:peptidylprolyl isomerase [uncultured Niameybacter sp.]
MRQKKSKGLFLIGICVLSLMSAGCSKGVNEEAQPLNEDNAQQVQIQTFKENPIVTLSIKDYGTVEIELYPEKAPNTVNNFVSLVNEGFYEGLTFHRIIEGFMIQGGDPEGVGTGGPGYSIAGEFAKNGYSGNDLIHTKGVISMARAQNPDSAGSQFFIMSADSPHLDGQYAAFGQVISGIEIIEALEKVETGSMDKPVEPVIIEKITVDTHGEQIPDVIKIEE